jgi:predicted XRE-type DNA-binding protein
MTTEQSKIDQQVRETIRKTMETAAPYEQARAQAYIEVLRKNYSHMDDDQFTTFINKKILHGQ